MPTATRMTWALPLVLALGCGAEADGRSDPDNPGGKADTFGDVVHTAREIKDAIRTFKDAVDEISATLNNSEAAVVTLTSHLPVGEVQIEDAIDLDPFTDAVTDVILDRILDDFDNAIRNAEDIVAGQAEFNVEATTLCEAFNVSDDPVDGQQSTPLERCEAIAALANVGVKVELGEGIIRISVTTELSRDGHPFVFTVKRVPDRSGSDGFDVALEIAAPEVRKILDLVEVLGDYRFGADKKKHRLVGTVRAVFRSRPGKGATLEVELPEDFAFVVGDDFAIEAEARHGPDGPSPVAALAITSHGEVSVGVAVGHLSARLPARVVNEDAPEDQRVEIDWGGLEATFAGDEDAVAFTLAQDKFDLDFSGGGIEEYRLSEDVLTAEVVGSVLVEGEIDRGLLRVDLEGFETTYESGLRVRSEHRGVVADTTISEGAVIVDLIQASSARKSFFVAEAKATLGLQGDNAHIDSMLCIADGWFEVEVAGEEPLVVAARLDDDESDKLTDHRCIVRYFTTEDGESQLHYTTMFR